jgi:hypothetical protein
MGIIAQRKKPIKTKNIIIKNPYGSMRKYWRVKFAGKKEVMIRDPSRGGMGIRLNTARIKLRKAPRINIFFNGKLSLIKTIRIKAKNIFAKGPDKPIHLISFFGFLKWLGFIGTGFAYPIANVPRERIRRKIGKSTVPKVSIWAKGFRVSRPESLGVGSPNLLAAQPWQYS